MKNRLANGRIAKKRVVKDRVDKRTMDKEHMEKGSTPFSGRRKLGHSCSKPMGNQTPPDVISGDKKRGHVVHIAKFRDKLDGLLLTYSNVEGNAYVDWLLSCDVIDADVEPIIEMESKIHVPDILVEDMHFTDTVAQMGSNGPCEDVVKMTENEEEVVFL